MPLNRQQEQLQTPLQRVENECDSLRQEGKVRDLYKLHVIYSYPFLHLVSVIWTCS